MSNTKRIWIGYFVTLLGPAFLLGPPLLLELTNVRDAPPIVVGLAGLVVWLIGAGMWFGGHGRCWRCYERLTAGPGGFHYPIVFWRHCSSCGVKHASRPDDVKHSAAGHFR